MAGKSRPLSVEIDIAPCRAAVSQSDFAAAAEEGRAMNMEQAIVYALASE